MNKAEFARMLAEIFTDKAEEQGVDHWLPVDPEGDDDGREWLLVIVLYSERTRSYRVEYDIGKRSGEGFDTNRFGEVGVEIGDRYVSHQMALPRFDVHNRRKE